MHFLVVSTLRAYLTQIFLLAGLSHCQLSDYFAKDKLSKLSRVGAHLRDQEIISQNNFYHLKVMRAENSIPNKIIPVKSLVQSTKHSTKKQTAQLANHEPHTFSFEHPAAHKHTQAQSNSQNQIYSQGAMQQLNPPKEKMKGISVGSKNYSLIKVSQQIQKNDTPHKNYKPFQEFSFMPKVQTYGHNRQESDIHRNIALLPESSKTPRRLENLAFQEKLGFKGLGSDKMQYFKSLTLDKFTQEQDPRSFCQRVSTKIQDQSWNSSKFQKVVSIQRETQPIFKDEVTKIKTQLFQKEAQLFQATQKLEQTEKIIRELRGKLEIEIQLNRTLKNRLNNQQIILLQHKNLQETALQNTNLNLQIQKLKDEIQRLKAELLKNKDQKTKQDHESPASTKLLQLKIKQFQLQQRQRTHHIMQLKEKEKRSIESYDKMFNGQRELLRQKEQQLAQISRAAQFYIELCTKNQKIVDQLKEKNRVEGQSKQFVIRQLSGEIGDLKGSLRNLQIRMRELIENEDELKKEIEKHISDKEEVNKQKNFMTQLKKQLTLSQDQISTLQSEKKVYLNRISELQSSLNSKTSQMDNNASLKEMQVSMMTKTCQEYRRKLDEYHKYSEQMRKSLQNYNQIQAQLKKVLIQKEEEIHLLKVRYDSPNKSTSPNKAQSPMKQGPMEDKEYTKLKNINVKLIKQNEKLNNIVKDLDFKICQLYKVNESLNQVILGQLFKELNQKLEQIHGVSEQVDP